MNMKREIEIKDAVIKKCEWLIKFANAYGGDAHANFAGGWEVNTTNDEETELSNDEFAIRWIEGTVNHVNDMKEDWSE